MNKTEMAKMEKQYQAEGDLHALIEAEKIKKDPARMKAAMAARKEKMTAMAALDNSKKGA
jgi:hypothetical protein